MAECRSGKSWPRAVSNMQPFDDRGIHDDDNTSTWKAGGDSSPFAGLSHAKIIFGALTVIQSRNGQFSVESKWMSCHFICLTSQSHRTRMISIIKWHLTIKHPKGISSEPHILPFKFATDSSILNIFERNWGKNTSWMEVFARDMPSRRVKIKVEMVRGLREGEGSTLHIHIFVQFLLCFVSLQITSVQRQQQGCRMWY